MQWPLGFGASSALGMAVVVVAAALGRGRSYAIFRGFMLCIHCLIASAIFPHVGGFSPLFLVLHACVFVQALLLVRPRLRSPVYRLLLNWPESVFHAGTLLALPWAVAAALGAEPRGWWVPYLLALVGLVQTLLPRKVEFRQLVVGKVEAVESLRRVSTTPEQVEQRPLRLAQLTDTHLGPFMSVGRLRKICERLVSAQPDLVLLTGDFLTMESQAAPAALAQALQPLTSLRGRVFACFGNHDHEAPETVRAALAKVGARLLVDEAARVDTAAGQVQVVGADFRYRQRAEHLAELCRKEPRQGQALRLFLLHDPGAFRHLPSGEADLVLSGHTHGGQLGLVSFGLPHTILSLFTSSPDHGTWGMASSRLYVHRGTGHYGFPLRLGVPYEESLLLVHRLR